MGDGALGFFFKDLPVRGHICRVGDSITAALASHAYPPVARGLLAEMAATSRCFLMDAKSDDCHGTLQIMGGGWLKMALIDAYAADRYRVCATFNETTLNEPLTLATAFGACGTLALTVDVERNRYQTIVALAGNDLETALRHYFCQSLQIPAIFVCKSSAQDESTIGGALALWRMPEEASAAFDEAWCELDILTSTLKTAELLNPALPLRDILRLLYNRFEIIVSRETIPIFSCSCSFEKVKSVIDALGGHDGGLPHIVVCEYCGKNYTLE